MDALEKYPVILKDDYTVYLERVEDTFWVHCDTTGWSKTIRKNLMQDWGEYQARYPIPFFAVSKSGDTKHHKFLTQMGFTYLQDVGDGVHRIYRTTGEHHGKSNRQSCRRLGR